MTLAPDAVYEYVSVSRLREEGIPTPAASPTEGISDARLRTLVRRVSRMINGFCDQWFQPVYVPERRLHGRDSSLVEDDSRIPIPEIRTLTFRADRVLPAKGDIIVGTPLFNPLQPTIETVPSGDFQTVGPMDRQIMLVGDIFSNPFVFGTSFDLGANNVLLDGWLGWLENRHRVGLVAIGEVGPPEVAPADGTVQIVEFDHRLAANIGRLRPDDVATIHDPGTGLFAEHVTVRVLTVDNDPQLDVYASLITDLFEVASGNPGADVQIDQIAPGPSTGITFAVTGGATVAGGTAVTVTPATATTPMIVVADVDPGTTPTSGAPGVGLIETLNADPTFAAFALALLPAGAGIAPVDTLLATTTLTFSVEQLRFRKLAEGIVNVEIILGPGPTLFDSEVEVDPVSPGVTDVRIYSDPGGTPFTVATMLAAVAAHATAPATISVVQIAGAGTDVIDSAFAETQIPFASFTHEPLDLGSITIPAGGIINAFGRTPEMIEFAAIRLVVRFKDQMATPAAAALSKADRVIEEVTDNYRYRLEPRGPQSSAGGGTGDDVVDRILQDFRAPPTWAMV